MLSPMGGRVLIGPLHRSGDEAAATIETAAGRTTITYAVPDGTAVAETADPVFAASLLPAMMRGERLEVGGPISPSLLERSSTIQDIFVTWDRALHRRSPWYRRIEVDAVPAELSARPPDRGAACFFTGGVDSFHSAIAHREELTALVYVWGFDVPLHERSRHRAVRDHLREAARLLDLPLIEVSTDVQTVMAELSGIPWLDQHGAALASVALLLAPSFSRLYIPSTSTYAQLESLGSHPLLDPLWSTEEVEIVHDGADATRLEKLRAIADHDAARRHLRVCWQNQEGRYNCGRCEKCVRTAVAARVAGVGGSFAMLPEPTTLDVARTRVGGPAHTWFECRDELAWSGRNPRLRWAIEAVLARRGANRLREARRGPR
jgi:7-cyano-7-deazaguanine synthase in queuosine biosynthesis